MALHFSPPRGRPRRMLAAALALAAAAAVLWPRRWVHT